jgi:hypothetical protein
MAAIDSLFHMMEPLETSPMPTHAVLVGIDMVNSWLAGTPRHPVRVCYVATNSTQRIAFVSLHNARSSHRILRAATRPAYFQDMPYGIVVELYLTEDLAPGETVYISLAQAGATSYYPPQPIDDTR